MYNADGSETSCGALWCSEMLHRHQSQPGMGTDCSQKHEPLFLETEIDRKRALEAEQFMHLNNSFLSFPPGCLCSTV